MACFPSLLSSFEDQHKGQLSGPVMHMPTSAHMHASHYINNTFVASVSCSLSNTWGEGLSTHCSFAQAVAGGFDCNFTLQLVAWRLATVAHPLRYTKQLLWPDHLYL